MPQNHRYRIILGGCWGYKVCLWRPTNRLQLNLKLNIFVYKRPSLIHFCIKTISTSEAVEATRLHLVSLSRRKCWFCLELVSSSSFPLPSRSKILCFCVQSCLHLCVSCSNELGPKSIIQEWLGPEFTLRGNGLRRAHGFEYGRGTWGFGNGILSSKGRYTSNR